LKLRRRAFRLRDAQQRGAHRAGRGAAGNREADFLAPPHCEQSQRADGIVDFIRHLQYPFHPQSLGAWPTANREWGHNLDTAIGLLWRVRLRTLYG